MNLKNSAPLQTKEDRILELLRKIVHASAGKDCIYRGEAEHYRKICSGLYRIYAEYKDTDARANLEKKKVERVKEYLPQMAKETDSDILAQLQHYGDVTNLIDFTEDYLVAIFFACYKSDGKDGRVIVLERPDLVREELVQESYKVVEPPRTIHRAESQKSVLVKSNNGVINPPDDVAFDVVCIPKDLKKDLKEYLSKHHGISAERIFSDIHGFIRAEKIDSNRWLASQELRKGEEAAEQEAYRAAIEHYDSALELRSDFLKVYINRGRVYYRMKMHDKSIDDYTVAIKMNPEDAELYFYRGLVYEEVGKNTEAITDYSNAIKRNPHEPTYLCSRAAVYHKNRIFDNAITDYSEVIKQKPNEGDFYFYRGTVYWDKGDSDNAIQDFKKGRELKIWTLQQIADYEKHFGVQLPEDIKAILTQAANSPD